MHQTQDSAAQIRTFFEPAVGRWARFSAYEVVDGYIRPCADASYELYDPWTHYYDIRREGKTDETPLESFVYLAERLKFKPARWPEVYVLTDESEGEVLAWCARYGLLGVLPHITHLVTLPTRWDTVPNISAPDAFIVPSVVRFIRTNIGWTARTTSSLMRTEGTPKPGKRGELLPAKFQDGTGVIIGDLRGHQLRIERLDETWSRFFPDVQSDDRLTYQYPMPLSDGFWQQYAEPVADFANAATELLTAVTALRALRPIQSLTEDERYDLAYGRDVLHALVSSVKPVLGFGEDGRPEMRWASGSLIGSIAMMALEDVSQGSLLRRCAVCGRAFATRDARAIYCTARCRRTSQKRASRARAKQREAGMDATSKHD